ncbi:MAG TPA: sulfatase [Blastocatellia bacterium]|nr:sulfatase [Blastocatellia bacterium]
MKILLCAALIFLCSLPVVAQPQRPPNIILILVDDYGWADTGCYGSTFHRTPNIDRLAAQGIRFTDAYAAAPVCSPTRASLMTGKAPARLHLTDWLPGRTDRPDQKMARPVIEQQLPLSEVTLAEALQQRGYATAHIGKWHLGGKGFAPEQQGFALNISGDHTGTPRSYFYPFQNKDGQMPGLETGREGEYLTDRLTDEAEKFIDRSKEQPFFLYLPHYTVHIPLKAKADLIAKYQALARPDQQHHNAIYAAMIEGLDDSVGRIVRKLEALRLDQNTIIIFTSDNGGLSVVEGPNTPATNNAPLRAGKGYLYEGGIRVPLIISGVGQAGSVNRTPVVSTDIYPTILALTGSKIPHGLDGANLVPLLRTGRALKRDALYFHYPHYSNQGGKPGSAIRQGDWKLIEFAEDNHTELYNLKNDLSETRNLAAESPARARALQQKLARWRRAVGAQMMTPNPNYRKP